MNKRAKTGVGCRLPDPGELTTDQDTSSDTRYPASVTESFIVCVTPEQLRKEKEKAAELRKSQWWKRRTARGLCWYCNKQVPPGELTMDHVVALARGGKSTRGNTVPACKECNSRKKYLLPIEWDQYLQGVKKYLPPEGTDTED